MKKLIIVGLLSAVLMFSLTACEVQVNGDTVLKVTDEDAEKLKELSKDAADKAKDIVTDEELQEAVKDAAGALKDAATKE